MFLEKRDDQVIIPAIDAIGGARLDGVLYAAIGFKRLEIVKYLLDTKHVSPDTIFNHISMLALALVRGRDGTPLIRELINRCGPATFTYQIQYHQRDYDTATPLILAAETNQPFDIFQQILDKSMGVIDAKNAIGRTALHYAAENNNIEVATLLLERGANRLVKDLNGYTPHNVAQPGDVKTLLDVGVQPGSPPRQGAAAAAAAAAGAGSPPGPVAPPSPSDPQPGGRRRTRRKRSKRRKTRARRSIKY